MTYLRTSHNLFALILVLLISLIANPVFAMSSHMALVFDATPKTTITTSHHPDIPHDKHPDHHQMSNNDPHCHDCQPAIATNKTDCSTMEMMANCTTCDSRHCQYSDLPSLLSGLTDTYNERLLPAFSSEQTISRNEDVLRPPIH